MDTDNARLTITTLRNRMENLHNTNFPLDKKEMQEPATRGEIGAVALSVFQMAEVMQEFIHAVDKAKDRGYIDDDDDGLITLDRKYMTRDGRPVELYTIHDQADYPIHGAFYDPDDGQWTLCSWTLRGFYITDDSARDYDLVPV